MHYHRRLFSIPGVERRLGLGLGLLLGSAGLALATALLFFLATSDGTAAHLEWGAASETELHRFELSYKVPVNGDFQDLVAFAPTGQLPYTFAETCLLQGRSGQLVGPLVYRLTLRCPSPDHTSTTTAVGTMGVLERSWGSVKVMFR